MIGGEKSDFSRPSDQQLSTQWERALNVTGL